MSLPLILNKGLSTEYTFPRSFSLDALPWMKRVDEMERVHQHGTVLTGDERIKTRIGRIWGTLNYSTRDAFRTALENMRNACYQEKPKLYADEYWPGKYLMIGSVSDFITNYLVTLRAADIEIIFKVIDPFWYSEDASSRAWSITANILSRTVTNSGLMEAHPIITYKAGGSQISLKVRNEDDGNREFTYSKAGGVLTLNEILEVDCVEGTVKKNGTNDIYNYRGPILRLVSGANRIRTTIIGAVGTSRIQFDFRARWL